MGVDPSVGAVLLSLLLTGLAVPGRHDRLIQDAALPHPAHRGPAGPRPTPTEDQIPETWPWARELEAAFLAAFALTAPP